MMANLTGVSICIKNFFFYIPRYTIVAGYYGFTLDIHVSVCIYARYIPRLAFVWVSVYSVIVGLKIGVVGLKIDKKNGVVGLKKIKERSKE